MIAFQDWLSRLVAKSSVRPSTTRRAQLDWLERRQLLTASEPIDTSVEPLDENLQTVIVVASSEPEILESPSTELPMGPLPLDEAGSGEGYGWVQGTGAGTGFVPGSVLASADSIQWGDNTIEDWEGTGDGYGDMNDFASGSGGSSGSGSGGTSESGSGGSSGSGSGGSSASGSGGSSGSGSGSSSGSGSGGSGSGSGSGSGDTAPVIHDFTWSMGNSQYTFSGSVTDDEDVYGLTIVFGGLLQGEIATVQQDGTFSFSINLENPIGEVTSIVQDYDQLWSEEEIVYV
jgi:hypothetical protein